MNAPPVTPEVLRALTINAIADAIEDRPEADPEDQLVAAVLETKVLAHGFHRLSREVRPDLAWRAEKMATSMTENVSRLFEGVNDEPTG